MFACTCTDIYNIIVRLEHEPSLKYQFDERLSNNLAFTPLSLQYSILYSRQSRERACEKFIHILNCTPLIPEDYVILTTCQVYSRLHH